METQERTQLSFSVSFWLLAILLVINLAVLLFNLGISSTVNSFLQKKIAENQEAARPANLEITVIKDSSCGDCFDLTPAIEAVKKENVKVTAEKTLEITDAEALEIINNLKIVKAPVFILQGELEKNDTLKILLQQMGEIKDNTFTFTKTGTPYILTASGDVRGRMKIVMLADKNCPNCYDVRDHDPILQRFDLNTSNQQILDIGLPEGKEFVGQYKVKLVPTFILFGDLNEFPALLAVWPQVGTAEGDGAYVFREGVKQMGIYKDLGTGKIITPTPENNQ